MVPFSGVSCLTGFPARNSCVSVAYESLSYPCGAQREGTAQYSVITQGKETMPKPPIR